MVLAENKRGIHERSWAKSLNSCSYIELYNMPKRKKLSIIHSPTLGSVLMVEKTVRKYSQQYGKYGLWKRLPKKMMYQTFLVIIDYLAHSGKLMIDKRDGIVFWTYDPETVKNLIDRGLVWKG